MIMRTLINNSVKEFIEITRKRLENQNAQLYQEGVVVVISIKQPILSGYFVFVSPFNLRSSPTEGVMWTLVYRWEPLHPPPPSAPTHTHTHTHADSVTGPE